MPDKAQPNACNKPVRKPSWLKMSLQNTPQYAEVSSLVKQHNLNTICSSGKCPNITQCWNNRVATFMIGGDTCSRACKFCATNSGKPSPLDQNEPIKIARSVKIMKLKHAVVTAVTRDDLADGGAQHWVNTIKAMQQEAPDTTIEVLIPDFNGDKRLLEMIVDAQPHIIGHNIETVERITPLARSRATYRGSLEVLRVLADLGADTKSGLMVGLGETSEEVIQTLRDLYSVGVRRATIGQYLQPTTKHLEVAEYITPDEFDRYAKEATEIGFTHIFSAPLVRSSYMAEL